MKLEIEGTPTVSTGVEEEISFEFANNAIAFDAFSSKLYTDKARAIIRELACNAADAHVAAGTDDKPFEIHLPTNHEPHFSINDYGTGLSHEDMKALFALYFGSNKRNDNRFIGALGLGSKSPFAYIDNSGSYSIISRHQGTTRMYVASKTNGKPKLEKVGEMQTPAAPNGIEIKFAIQTRDIWEWENKAKLALEFFDPMPVVNIENFQPSKQNYILKTDKWALRTEAKTTWGYGVRAVMGKVQYAVGDIDVSRVNSTQQKVLGMPIDLFFPLGELDFAISREALEMKPRTVANILKAVDDVYEEFIDTVKAKIDACEHTWEARLMLYSLINSASNTYGSSHFGGLINEALNKGRLYGQYKNFEFTEHRPKLDEIVYENIAVMKFTRIGGNKRARKEPMFTLGAGAFAADSIIDYRGKAKLDKTWAKQYQHEIEADPTVHFVINDSKVPGDKYVHYFLQQADTNKKIVYLINRRSKNSTREQVLRDGERLLDSLGSPQFEFLSALQAKYGSFVDPAPGTDGARQKRVRREVVTLQDPGSKYRYTAVGWMKAWRKPESIPVGTKYYVALDRLVATDTKFNDAWEFHTFVNNVRASGKFGIGAGHPIYGIKRNSKLLKNNDDGEWVELMSYVFAAVKKIMTPKKTMALSLNLKPFDDSLYHDFLVEIAEKADEGNPALAQDSPIQSFALALAEAEATKDANWQTFQKVLALAENRGKYTPGTVANFNSQWKQVKALYPLLTVISGFWERPTTGRVKEPVLEYIRMVDEARVRETLANAAASNS